MTNQPDFSLAGRTALITGSTRGIGRAIAETLAGAGAHVIISSRTAKSCEDVAEAIRADGGQATGIPCDISRKDQVAALVEKAGKAAGPIDILVANAAANPVFGPMRDLPDEAFDKIMRTNVQSTLWLVNSVAPGMEERSGGAILVISSIAGLAGSRHIGAYALSKAADFQLVRNLALEWGGAGIRANALAPGLVKTDFARALWEDERTCKAVEARTPLGRIAGPADMAGPALFLVSDAARYITGQMLVVDGGLTIADVL